MMFILIAFFFPFLIFISVKENKALLRHMQKDLESF